MEQDNSRTEDQQGFLAFIAGLTNVELARTYSSYRFLAEFKSQADIWKRDACRTELLRRELSKAVTESEGKLPEFGADVPEFSG